MYAVHWMRFRVLGLGFGVRGKSGVGRWPRKASTVVLQSGTMVDRLPRGLISNIQCRISKDEDEDEGRVKGFASRGGRWRQAGRLCYVFEFGSRGSAFATLRRDRHSPRRGKHRTLNFQLPTSNIQRRISKDENEDPSSLAKRDSTRQARTKRNGDRRDACATLEVGERVFYFLRAKIR